MLLEIFIIPFSYDFMQIALASGVIIGFICSLFSCFLILKGWSLMGDSISHSVLPGIVFGYAVGLPLSIGAFFSGMLSAVLIGFIKEQNYKLKEDAVMGIVFSTFFALGVIAIVKVPSDLHLMHILFGNILGVNPNELVETAIISSIALLILILKKNDLVLYLFDSKQAEVIGIKTRYLHYLLLIILSLVIVSSIKAVGIIMVIAMLIIPGSCAFILSNRFNIIIIIAVCIGVISSYLGILLSFHLDLDTAPLIILCQTMLFTLSVVYKLIISSKLVSSNKLNL